MSIKPALYYGLIGEATKEYHAMSTYQEKVGAHRIISLLSSYLTTMLKTDKPIVDAKLIIKTLAGIEQNFFQDLLHLTPSY
jgi:hypothetical protein